jgi:predicted Zn-dependent peptidase
MMKKIFFTLLMMGQIIMATTIQYIETEDFKVPVIFEEDRRLPLVNMQFIFQNSGSITDIKKAGLAKFSAKILGEGTKELGSSAFAESLESKAIHISSHAGSETLVIELGCLKEEFGDGLEKLQALLSDPNISENAVKKVKTTTLGSLSSKQNDFDYVASNELKRLLFKDTPLASPSSGTLKSVESIELKDVKNFIEEHLVSSKLIIAIGGDIDIEAAKKEIQKIIASMPKGELKKLAHYEVNEKVQESILKKETEQAYVYFGSPYKIDYDSVDYYKAKVAIFILGTGGFGSRLMEEIRVKQGLAYSAYARLSVSKSSSYLTGYLQTKLDSLEVAQKSVKEVIAEFVKSGVTEDELEQTKKFLLGSEPLRAETMSQRLNRTFMEFYKGQELGHSQKELELIKKLTLKDLNEFIKNHKEILDLSFAIVTK